ncbi:Rad52/Rad22 family DNA repair protein [Aulosira sp. FACHB-615]|uniref:Rad52/Rad22 family DNA repair protein n=1 Tax=Aulosira sp. FACHB-615 TaxID=2692777 RepID=UPI0016874615|nr:Rad52/Rad22 family DNA repair protein [Aulosira sp. FACHB-615]MBD2488972.1 hypothetical protein [Aulosira sp. FACHB-615]
MITPEIRDELRRIQIELKKPLPPQLHEVRDLPGTDKKWVFLRWQTIRDRLDEVAPDWMSDYSEIQYLGNEATCRCAITILGIRKEAIASVPLSMLSKNNKEMTRGSAPDRLSAEGLKNAAENWGVGRYLDDQQFTIQYLWDNRTQLSDEMNRELQLLIKQYKIATGMMQPRPQMPAKKEAGILPTLATLAGQPDRNLLNAEIESVMKRKGISLEQAKSLLSELFSVKSRQQLNERQLQEFLEYLKTSREVVSK